MTEVGKIVKLNGVNASVEVVKKDECSKCGMCMFPKNASSIEINAINSISAKVGDTVEIETIKDYRLLGAILTFLVPLILIALGTIFVYAISIPEIWILPISLILIFLWYTILALIDKKFKNLKKFSAVIIKIIHEKGEENE